MIKPLNRNPFSGLFACDAQWSGDVCTARRRYKHLFAIDRGLFRMVKMNKPTLDNIPQVQGPGSVRLLRRYNQAVNEANGTEAEKHAIALPYLPTRKVTRNSSLDVGLFVQTMNASQIWIFIGHWASILRLPSMGANPSSASISRDVQNSRSYLETYQISSWKRRRGEDININVHAHEGKTPVGQ